MVTKAYTVTLKWIRDTKESQISCEQHFTSHETMESFAVKLARTPAIRKITYVPYVKLS